MQSEYDRAKDYTTRQAQSRLRTWIEQRNALREAAGTSLPGDWIPVLVDKVLDRLEALEEANEGMIVTDLEHPGEAA